METDAIPGALEHQALQCDNLGSPLYAAILRHLMVEYDSPGIVRSILRGSSETPVHDAIPLRFLGALHHQVLLGGAPSLGAHYPSVGGTPGPGLVEDLRESIDACADSLREGLTRQVQTNEVGRSTVLLALCQWLAELGVTDFDLLEVGASAGLNLCFPEFSADTGDGVMGATSSAVTFGPSWFDIPPRVSRQPAAVVRALGCDPYPVDVHDEQQATRLMSFVWPDQVDRMARLKGAIDIARRSRPSVTRASADAWLDSMLSTPMERTTVVFHSIVWQYLDADVRAGIRHRLAEAGSRANDDRRLMWVRMEPAGAVADVRADVWDGSAEEPFRFILGHVGYHGQGLRWNPIGLVD